MGCWGFSDTHRPAYDASHSLEKESVASGQMEQSKAGEPGSSQRPADEGIVAKDAAAVVDDPPEDVPDPDEDDLDDLDGGSRRRVAPGMAVATTYAGNDALGGWR